MKAKIYLSINSAGLLLPDDPKIQFANRRFRATTAAEIKKIESHPRFKRGQIIELVAGPNLTDDEQAAVVLGKRLRSELKKDQLRRRADFLAKEFEAVPPEEDATIPVLIDFIVLQETGVDLPALADK